MEGLKKDEKYLCDYYFYIYIMKTYTKTVESPRLIISYEDCPESPRKWSNLGYFITVDRNYHSPDKNETLENIIKETGNIAKDQKHHMQLIKKEILKETGEKVIAIYPVSKYEHSGVVYKLGTTCGFDFSNNGFYIVTEESQKELGTPKKLFEKVIRQELETYTKYVNGEVYQFILRDENGDIEDSCCSFYSIDEIKECLPEDFKNEDLKKYFIY